MQILCGNKGQAVLGQRPGGTVQSFKFVHEVLSYRFPITGFGDFLFIPKIVEDIRWVFSSLVDLWIAALVFG